MAKNLDEIYKQIQAAISNTLLREVATTVKEVMHEEVHSVVYEVYTPRSYERLEDQGGLSDIANMDSSLIDDNTLAVSNIRQDDAYPDRDVPLIVTTGRGYMYNITDPTVLDGRDFTSATVEELKSSGGHISAMKDGLIRNGLNVK